MHQDDFNISFRRGNVPFLKFIIDKFADRLPYQCIYPSKVRIFSSCRQWALLNNYSYQSLEVWHIKGSIPPRVMNLIHKDLCILRQADPTVPTIQELFREFKELNAPIDSDI